MLSSKNYVSSFFEIPRVWVFICTNLKCAYECLHASVRSSSSRERENYIKYWWNFLLVVRIVTLSQHFICSTKFPSPLAMGWDRMTICSQQNVRNEVTSPLKPWKAPAKFSCFFLPLLLGQAIVTTKQHCPFPISLQSCMTGQSRTLPPWVGLVMWATNRLLLY